jgi:hypothetical protein
MLKHSAALFIFLFLAALCAPVLSSSTVTLSTESAMRDKDGNVIRDCQQPYIAKFGEKWYAYGFSNHDYQGDSKE